MTGSTAVLPLADLVTDCAALVLADRPVVALTRGLADTAGRCAALGLELQVVTPPYARVTWPLEQLLSADGACWVVQGPGVPAVDGLRGGALQWDGAAFVPGPDGPATAGTAPSGGVTVLDLTLLHAARTDLLLGHVVEDCLLALTGQPPRGWGVAEPAASRWDTAELTRLCRTRAPDPTTLVVVGDYDTVNGSELDRAAVGTLEVHRVPSGVTERLRLLVGAPAPPDVAALDTLAARLAERHPVRTLLVGLRPGRSDATRAAGAHAPVLPRGLLVGAEGVAERTVEAALRAPGQHVELVGRPARPSCWVRLDPARPDALDLALAHLLPRPPGGGAT